MENCIGGVKLGRASCYFALAKKFLLEKLRRKTSLCVIDSKNGVARMLPSRWFHAIFAGFLIRYKLASLKHLLVSLDFF